jgi:sulfite reductase alpha subunit-like flavoprotein
MGMAPAVADAFAQIAQTQGGHSDGRAWLNALVDEGRYKTDVY